MVADERQMTPSLCNIMLLLGFQDKTLKKGGRLLEKYYKVNFLIKHGFQ